MPEPRFPPRSEGSEVARARTLVDEWVQCGVSDAVLAPSAPLAPLALALAEEGRVRIHVIADARSGAFFALGLGMGTGRPAIIAVSGHADAADTVPAVIEADRGGIPLLVVTVDGSIHGDDVVLPAWAFRSATTLGTDVGDVAESDRRVAREVAQAATSPHPGPAHFAVVADAPTRPTVGTATTGAMSVVDAVGALTQPIERGLLIVGAGGGEPEAVHAAARALGWPVLADPRSSCRTPTPMTIAAADSLLQGERFREAHRPDAVLRLGAPWASDALASALHEWATVEIVLGPGLDPTELCTAVAARGPVDRPSPWLESWAAAEAAAQAAIDAALADIVPITEPWLCRVLAAQLPQGTALVTSAAMARRDVEAFSRPRYGLRVLGTGAVDGVGGAVATALGVAASHAGPTVALTGDLAFLHDVNGLMAIKGTAAGLDCTIVVVDNDGSALHSMLPVASELPDTRFERLMGAAHGLDIASVAAAHGAPAYRVPKLPDFLPTVEASMAAGGVRVVHVRTDRTLNVSVHRRIQQSVTAVINALAQSADSGP